MNKPILDKILGDKKLVVFISHSDATKQVGGVEKYILNETAYLNENSHDVLQIYGIKKKVRIFRIKIGNSKSYGINLNNKKLVDSVSFSSLSKILKELLKKERIESFNIHHLLGFGDKSNLVSFLAKNSKNVPIFTYLHDNYMRCESIFLLKNSKKYCGAAEIEIFYENECNSCKFGGARMALHNAIFDKLFEISSKIIVPSGVTSEILKRYYPNKEYLQKIQIFDLTSFEVLPSKISNKNLGGKPKIAFIGNKLYIKGFNLFARLIEDKKLLDLYDFYLIGPEFKHPNVKNILVSYGNIAADNQFNSNMVKALFDNQIDIALLWSLTPESYCYAAFEAFAVSIPIITNKISGNIKKKVAENEFYGKIFEAEDEVVEFLYSLNNVESFLKNNPNHHNYRMVHNSFLKNHYESNN